MVENYTFRMSVILDNVFSRKVYIVMSECAVNAAGRNADLELSYEGLWNNGD